MEDPKLYTIVLIEDDELILKMTEFKLKQAGFKIYIAKDGDSGIRAIRQHVPDLVITDIMLPYKSGLEVTHLSKKEFPDIPIIILSSLGDEENAVDKAFSLGADDFISKPFNPNELVLRVKRFLIVR
ncbi:response regulator transcription factor [Belliella kenyensis]|uniref:Response regulator transcription factor n=1 Tax=Belliella kenyensis TaxID=1472724 RepID=A0ABV8EG16_9BACT|nr:response regulator [Belliella kenyensis]MCH7401198.1 response regulator [Belliella kenyensis]MDN3604195.1 response regulator [Belliella kenyensis]